MLPPKAVSPTEPQSLPEGKWLKDLAIITGLSLIWFCSMLGMRPLSNPDEGRYTEIPREMAASGNYVTPRLNGVLYLEKPPLVYWLSAVTLKTFGVNEFTARFWNAVSATAGVLAVYGTARAIHGRVAGIWSAIILSTSLLYYVLSQIILLDMAVSVTMSGALFAFILAIREAPGRKRKFLFAAFYLCIALATLSKGLIGIVLPGAVIFLWLLLLKQWKSLWPFYPILGTLIVLAIAAPWHVLAARETPDFLNFYFVHEHFLRFTTRIHSRYEPWWYFIPYFIGGLFPWVFFAMGTLRDALKGGWKERNQSREIWFFLIWIGFMFLFFSKSQSKLVPYILPLIPPAAVMLGIFLSGAWKRRTIHGIRVASISFTGVAILLAVAVIVAPNPKNQPELVALLPIFKPILAIIMISGAAGVMVGLKRGNARFVISSIALSSGLFLAGFNYLGGSFDKSSTKQLALMLKPRLQPNEQVYALGYYPQDLPAYLGRTINVVGYEGELEYGIKAEPTSTDSRFLDKSEFHQLWEQSGRRYAVLDKKSFQKWFGGFTSPPEIIGQTPRYILVVNHSSQP